MSEADTRYRKLEQVAEAVCRLDANSKSLAVQVGKLRRQARLALEFRETTPRNPRLDEARSLAVAANAEKNAQHRAVVTAKIAELRAQGVTQLKDIAAALNAAGIQTSRGGPWSTGTVGRYIER